MFASLKRTVNRRESLPFCALLAIPGGGYSERTSGVKYHEY